MESHEVKTKKQETSQFRVNLKREAFERVTRWAGQIKGQRKGVKVRIGDMVEYVLMAHSEYLTNAEVKDFEASYTSDIELAKWLVKELTAAEKRGEKLTLSELVASSRSKASTERATSKRRETAAEKVALSDEKIEPTQKN